MYDSGLSCNMAVSLSVCIVRCICAALMLFYFSCNADCLSAAPPEHVTYINSYWCEALCDTL